MSGEGLERGVKENEEGVGLASEDGDLISIDERHSTLRNSKVDFDETSKTLCRLTTP